MLSVTLAGDRLGQRGSSERDLVPEDVLEQLPAGTKVTLSRVPIRGRSFTGWSGGGCSGTGTCTVTMSADQGVTATFVANHR